MRCVNIDWLEVHCYEPVNNPHTSEYYRDMGYICVDREYGTRVYHEMFTIYDNQYNPLIEIRRNPKSQGEMGIHSPNMCHIRLCNRSCYFDTAAIWFQSFLNQHQYDHIRISRIDICHDFERFDSGDYPQKFIDRYMKGKYAKINQSELRAYGKDRWDSRTWTSLSWGSAKSSISTKLYNKTKELTEAKDKPYIRQAWYQSGLIDNPINCTIGQGDTMRKPDIWRLEFSIRSPRLNWFTINPDGNDNKYHSYQNTLEIYKDRPSIMKVFATLQEHYFHFRYYEEGKRKYDCKRKQLYDIKDEDQYYRCQNVVTTVYSEERALHKLAMKLARIRDKKFNQEQREIINEVIRILDNDAITEYAQGTLTPDEVRILRLAIANKTTTIRLQQQLSRLLNEEGTIW